MVPAEGGGAAVTSTGAEASCASAAPENASDMATHMTVPENFIVMRRTAVILRPAAG